MKNNLLFIVFIAFTNIGFSQCLCADLHITLPLSDIEMTADESNYQVQIIQEYSYRDKPDEMPPQQFPAITLKNHHFKFSTDTLFYSFATGGGLKKLTFKIIRVKDGAEMQITATNMYPDIDFGLIFNEFTEGDFAFDWEEIDSCQRENLDNLRMICGGKRLEQERLLKENERKFEFMRNLVKVNYVEDFRE